MRLIETRRDIEEGLAHLTRVEPRFRRAIEISGPPPLRRRPGGFPTLVEIVVGQQVSTASARAIRDRIRAAGRDQAEPLAAATEAELRALGLSRPKVRALKAAASAALEGRLDFDRLRDAPIEDALAEMTAIWGVGPWTAEIYQLFAVGRADLLPTRDLALQEGARSLLDLPTRPEPADLAVLAAPWAPWRAVAARALWAYYAAMKGRSGVTLAEGGEAT